MRLNIPSKIDLFTSILDPRELKYRRCYVCAKTLTTENYKTVERGEVGMVKFSDE